MKKLIPILLAAHLLVAAGCSKSDTRTMKTSDGREVTLSGSATGASMEVKGPNGEKQTLQASATGVAIPADFPKDVPIFPKAKLRLVSGGGAMRMFGFVLPSSAADGVAFYEKEFAAQGWKVNPHMAMGQGFMLQGSKEGRSVMVMIGPDGKDMYAQITLSGAGK